MYSFGMNSGPRDGDTGIGGAGHRFPDTHRSVVMGLRSPDTGERRQGFEVLVAAYWKPVYKHIRLRWRRSNEDAKDLTQGFFLRAMEKDFFASYDSAKARFRTFLRTCLDGYLSNEAKAARASKRGGDAVVLSLDFDSAEGEIAGLPIASPETVESAFEGEWVKSLLGLAIDALRKEAAARGREVSFRLFERYDLWELTEERPTYGTLATEMSMPVTSVTNHLAWARRAFRRLLLEKLREITASDEEFRMEARELLGEDVE